LVDASDTLREGEEGDPMRKARREFSPEFKREAVALLEGSGRPRMQIAAGLGIQPSWLEGLAGCSRRGSPSRSQAGQAATTGQATASPADLASENAKLRREPDRTRMERDVPKKAIGIVAEVPRRGSPSSSEPCGRLRGRASCGPRAHRLGLAATTLGARGRRALAPWPTAGSWPRSGASRSAIVAAPAARASAARVAW